MFCKWCGMESDTTDRCSWCHRPFATQAATLSKDASSAPETAAALTVAQTPQETPAPPALGAMSLSQDDAPAAETASAAAPSVVPWMQPPTPTAPPPAEPSAPAADLSRSASSTPGGSGHPIIGVRRPGAPRPMGHVPAPAMPRPTSSQAPPSARPPTTQGGASPPLPSQVGVRTNTPRQTGQPHVPAPPMPMSAPRPLNAGGGSAAPSRPVVPLMPTAEVQSSAPPMPAPAHPSSRPSLPSSLLGATTPTVSMPTPTGQSGSGSLAGSTALADVETQSAFDAPRGHSPAMQAAAELKVPPFGMFPTTQSKYYPGQLVDSVSGTHYDSDSGLPTQAQRPHTNGATAARKPEVVLHWDTPATTNSRLVMRFLGVFGPILAVAGLVSYAFSPYYVVPLLLAQFVGALLLPVMGVVPWADEDADDVFLFLLLTLAGGPLVALVVYGVIGALRQNANPGIVGCLGIALLTRLVMDSVAGGFSWEALNPFAQVGHFDWRLLLLNWSGLATLVGWYAASVFHKLDE